MDTHAESISPLGICRRDVVKLYGSESLVKDCVRAKWLKPLVRRGRLTLFDHEEVLAVWNRIKCGELPPHVNS